MFILASTQVFAWKPIMIGHRGCRMGVENTEQAFINGVDVYGFQGLECDVKVTKDGHYVCWHDDNIPNDKISNRNYDVAIASNLLKDLQDLDLTQTRNSVSYTGKICTVDRYLEICKQKNVIPVIELKSNTTICNENMTGFPGLYELIVKHGLESKAIILTSMSQSLVYIKNNYPSLKRQYLVNYIDDTKIEFCKTNCCDLSSSYYYNSSNKVTQELADKCHNAGIKLAIYTVNNIDYYNSYAKYGASYVTSDDLGPKKVTLAELTGTDPNASKMIYFRPGTTNFSHGYQTITQAEARSETAGETINNKVGLYAGVFWIKNAYVAIEVQNANGDSKFISKGIYRPDLFDDPTKRFLAMPLPEGYTKIAAYRLNSITTDDQYTTWTNNPTTNISNRIPIIGTDPGTIDIPSGDKNLLVNKEGWWDVWYWAYYLPKNNDVCIYFANNNKWEKVKMLTGKDIYTFPTAEFTKINGTELYYHSLIGTDLGYEYYGFINSNEDHLGKGWTKGLIPPVNFTKSNAQNTSGIAGNNQFAIHNYVDHESITDAAENTNLTNGTYVKDGTYKIEISSTKANRIANRIKDAPNYTGLRDDLLKGINLFTPSSENGSAVAKTPITSWQDLNHTQTIKVEGGGKINYYTHKLKSASESKTETDEDQTGTVTFTAAYTATVALRAKKVDGYVFMGWFEEGSNTPLAAEVEAATGDVIYRYEAPNATPKALIARYEVSVNKQLRAQTYLNNIWEDDYTGGQFTINYNNGSTAIINQKPASGKWHNYDVSVNYPANFQATANTDYTFVGWWNDTKGVFTDNPWTMDNPADYDQKVTARFAQMYAQTIETTNNGGTVRIDYNIARKDTFAITTSGTYNVLTNSTVKVTANPFTGAVFDGWYVGGTCVSTKLTYSYNATAVKTLTAQFTIPEIPVSTQIYQILTYNTEFDIFEEYNTGNAGKINISYTSKEHGAKNINTESSCAITDVKPETSVTLTASLIRTDHQFLGWYDETGGQIGTNTTYTYTPTTGKIIQARYAPTNSWWVRLYPNIGGLYTLRYSKDADFTTSYSVESSYTQYINAYVPKYAYLSISSVQPIAGYKALRYKRVTQQVGLEETVQCSSNGHYIQVEFVREDEQVVYLNLKGNGGNIPSSWSTSTPDQYAYYAFVDNSFFTTKGNLRLEWIKMDHVQDYCYRCTIPGNKYNRISFVQICKDSEGNFVTDGRNQEPITTVNIDFDTIQQLGLNYVRDILKLERRRTTLSTIPATTSNCYRLSALWKGGGWVDCWTTPPTQTNDYRLLYREQTVKSKTEIEIDYEHNSDIVKYEAEGTKVDTLSLHIYNKVSNDGVNAINNPEIILQQYDGSKWVDKESYMVFGPLKSDNPSVIRMPERKNSAEIVVNRGIDIIKNDPTDNGCGVWNFPITQTDGEVTLNLDKVCRYSGNYYICTSNADGGRENYTHPANVLKYSKYAKENDRGYSHYFLRYINIATNDKPGTYKNLKFNIACDYASFLSKEHLTMHNRFKNSKGEYDRDIYVLEVEGEPNLAENANVRFSWDIVTNRVFRSYIAETSYRTNEHLVLDATNGLSNINPNDNYFVDNGNWIYNIDFNATSSANAKVKARLNGQYQYFMGSEDATEPITIGTGSTTFPARLLYDFKDDRLITFYKPDGIINGNIELATPLMMVREHHGEATQIQFANSGNQITTKSMDANDADDQYANPVYAVLTFLKSKLTDPAITHHEKSFYWISFPFDVKIKDVFGLGKYGQKWLIETYDGDKRSKEGLVTTGWKYITNTGTILKANKGYVLSLDYNLLLQENMFDGSTDGKISIFFPSRYLQNKQVIKNEEDVVVSLPEYVSNATAPHHWNWHTIGVPSFANSKVTIEQNDMPFVYEYWHPGDAYGPVAHGEKPLKAMHSYMAQYSGNITWESIIRMTPLSIAAKKDADADKNIMLRLELQQAGSTIDKTYVQLRNDKGTKGFDMSLDLTKIINAGANIYSIVDNHEMAGNAIPKDETVLPLGVVITTAGEYTFAMPNGTEGMIVELIDYEQGTSTNLLMSDYTITLNKGTFNQRFALRLVPDKVATSVDNIGNEANGDEVRKLLIDGVLYLQQGTNTYDAQGKHVQ